VNRRVLDRTLICKKRWEQLDVEKLACIEEELLGTAEDPVWIDEPGASCSASSSNNDLESVYHTCDRITVGVVGFGADDNCWFC